MKILLLVNDKRVRESLAAGLNPGIDAVFHPTVSAAEYSLAGRPFDLIVIDTKVYPGFGSRDAVIQELARVLPSVCYSETLAYWQVGLQAIDMIRGKGSANADTPILIRFPTLMKTEVGVQDVLTEDAVLDDLKSKAPIEPLCGLDVAGLIARINAEASSPPPPTP
jgi:hypothetical protein